MTPMHNHKFASKFVTQDSHPPFYMHHQPNTLIVMTCKKTYPIGASSQTATDSATEAATEARRNEKGTKMSTSYYDVAGARAC